MSESMKWLREVREKNATLSPKEMWDKSERGIKRYEKQSGRRVIHSLPQEKSKKAG